MVTQDESYNKEGNTKEHSYTSNQMDEMVDFLSNGCLSSVQTRSQTSNTTHHSVITATDNNTLCST